MNQAICYSTLTFSHKNHPLQFTIGLGFRGELINGRIKNIDLNLEEKDWKNLILK